MTLIDDLDDYELEVGDPYLTKDLLGKYVVLQDETLTRYDGTALTHSEILLDDNPSDHVIFVMKLRGAVRESLWNTRLPIGTRENIESTVRRLKGK